LGGAHRDHKAAAETVKNEILKQLKVLAQRSPEQRTQDRMEKFCKMGVVEEMELK
jgi:acetyl-CoA carboxylase carboxyl transferase subunit alpha